MAATPTTRAYLETVTNPDLKGSFDFNFLDENNPHSLINILPATIASKAKNIPLKYFTLPEFELRKLFEIKREDTYLRLKLWDEYGYAQDHKAKMRLGSICHGICSPEYWADHVYTSDIRFAYILRPPIDYAILMRTKLHRGMEQIDDILDAPIYKKIPLLDKNKEPILDKNGRPKFERKYDAAVMDKVIKVVQWLDMRVNGAVTQRLQIDQRSVNVNVDQSKLPAQAEEVSLEYLQSLEAKMNSVNRLLSDGTAQEVIEGEVTDGSKEDSQNPSREK